MRASSNETDQSENIKTESMFKRFFNQFSFFQSDENDIDIDIEKSINISYQEYLQAIADGQEVDERVKLLVEQDKLADIQLKRNQNSSFYRFKQSGAKNAGEYTVQGIYEGSKFGINATLEYCGYYTPQRKQEI